MWKNLPFSKYLYASIVLNIVSIVTIFALKSFLPPVVPLFYGLPGGVNQLVPKLGLIIAPGAGILVALINVILVSFVKDLFFKRTLVVSSIFVSILLFITTIKIILLVGFF